MGHVELDGRHELKNGFRDIELLHDEGGIQGIHRTGTPSISTKDQYVKGRKDNLDVS